MTCRNLAASPYVDEEGMGWMGLGAAGGGSPVDPQLDRSEPRKGEDSRCYRGDEVEFHLAPGVFRLQPDNSLDTSQGGHGFS
jgi:hypothetical protein